MFGPLGVKNSLFFWAWGISKTGQQHWDCKSPYKRISSRTTPQTPQQTVKAALWEVQDELERSLCQWWAENTWVQRNPCLSDIPSKQDHELEPHWYGGVVASSLCQQCSVLETTGKRQNFAQTMLVLAAWCLLTPDSSIQRCGPCCIFLLGTSPPHWTQAAVPSGAAHPVPVLKKTSDCCKQNFR